MTLGKSAPTSGLKQRHLKTIVAGRRVKIQCVVVDSAPQTEDLKALQELGLNVISPLLDVRKRSSYSISRL